MLDQDKLSHLLQQVEAQEKHCSLLPDEALRAKTAEFRSQLSNDLSLDELLPEAFAVVRESARRTLGIWLHDGQVLAGIIIHHRAIAQMPYGEGKTLAIIMPSYLNALVSQVHVVGVHDAQLQRAWRTTRQVVYEFLGIFSEWLPKISERKGRTELQDKAHIADVIYGSGKQFIENYLARHWWDLARAGVDLDFAIVDDADLLLADRAAVRVTVGDTHALNNETQRSLQICAASLDTFWNARTLGLGKKTKSSSPMRECARRKNY